MFCLHTCMWNIGIAGACRGQQRVSEPCYLPRGSRALNPGPLKEQHMLLGTEPSLQFPPAFFLLV